MDDRDVLVSSWNIDPRSYQTNLESGAVVTGCPGLVADINVQYDQLLRTHKADELCVPCKADFNRQWMSDSVFCGGTPDFYYRRVPYSVSSILVPNSEFGSGYGIEI